MQRFTPEKCEREKKLSVQGILVHNSVMDLRLILLVLLAAAACLAHGAEFARHEYKGPDHLEPVKFDLTPGYLDAVHARLKLRDYLHIEMVMMPAFVPESAVCLRSEPSDRLEKATKVFLDYSVAAKQIYGAVQPRNANKKPEDVAVTFTTVEFSKPVALRLFKLWTRMLLRTHYPQHPSEILVTDGTFFEFGCTKIGFGTLYGEAYFPNCGKSPTLLADLGLALMEYCKAAPAERPAVMKKVETTASQLETYLGKYPAW
jgi:hypothetical protein